MQRKNVKNGVKNTIKDHIYSINVVICIKTQALDNKY